MLRSDLIARNGIIIWGLGALGSFKGNSRVPLRGFGVI